MLPWVLLPGTLCTDACFAPTLAALAARGITPPTSTFLPGHSADPREDASALLREAPERFVICAFSLGGIVAFQAALAAPERIAAMILISVTGRADPAENAAVRRAQLDRARRESPVAVVRDVLWPNYVAACARDDRALQSDVETMAANVDLERYARQTELAIVRPDVGDALARLSMPALVISGEADRATLPDRGAEVAGALADGQHTVITDAGHFVMMERPTTTADTIASWVGSTGGALTHGAKAPQGEQRP